VILIDEIDKADIEFPNDLLRELDRMEFYVYETQQTDPRQTVARLSSLPRTTRRSCRMPSCVAASSTTSSFPTRRRWKKSSGCISQNLKKNLLREAHGSLLRTAPGPRAEKEALDFRVDRLAKTAGG
jgi:hypothetical protein